MAVKGWVMAVGNERSSSGLTRREALKRGATLAGALLWTTPVVQTVGMSAASAQEASGCQPGIEFIGINVLCSNEAGTEMVTLYRRFHHSNGAWQESQGAGNVQCDGFVPAPPQNQAPDGLVLSVSGNQQSATILISHQPDEAMDCVIDSVAVSGGDCCEVFANVDATALTVSCPVCE